MSNELDQLREQNRVKALRTIDLVAASLADFTRYDPLREYSPKELEPYDALADRFVRAVECALRYFRSHELAEFAEQSDSTRALLGRMEKLGAVSSTEIWFAMRNVRNRIVHDYLPEQTAQMFDEIAQVFGLELIALGQRLKAAAP